MDLYESILSLTGSKGGTVSMETAQELAKALEAGGGSGYESTGGRALQVEDVEGTLQVALVMSESDFKMNNILSKQRVTNTVHQYSRKLGIGENPVRSSFTAERGEAAPDASQYDRISRPMKYMQTLRDVPLQLSQAKTVSDPEAEEKLSGVMQLLVDSESCNFHGDSAVIPEEYDSALVQIERESKSHNLDTSVDLRGESVENKGIDAIEEAAYKVANAGGCLSHVFMPLSIVQGLQNAVKSKLFITPRELQSGIPVLEYPTVFGNLKIAGESGGCKFYRPKGVVSAYGKEAPGAAALTVSSAADESGRSRFGASDAGTYYYTVHAVSIHGISAGVSSAAVTIASGDAVTLTITANASNPGTGFIICRSKKDGSASDTREMARIGKSPSGNTVFVDRNEDLPGTASMLLLSMNQLIQPSIRWDDFLPTTKIDMFPTNKLVKPFIIARFGSIDVRVPWYHSVIKNVYAGW